MENSSLEIDPYSNGSTEMSSVEEIYYFGKFSKFLKLRYQGQKFDLPPERPMKLEISDSKVSFVCIHKKRESLTFIRST